MFSMVLASFFLLILTIFVLSITAISYHAKHRIIRCRLIQVRQDVPTPTVPYTASPLAQYDNHNYSCQPQQSSKSTACCQSIALPSSIVPSLTRINGSLKCTRKIPLEEEKPSQVKTIQPTGPLKLRRSWLRHQSNRSDGPSFEEITSFQSMCYGLKHTDEALDCRPAKNDWDCAWTRRWRLCLPIVAITLFEKSRSSEKLDEEQEDRIPIQYWICVTDRLKSSFFPNVGLERLGSIIHPLRLGCEAD